MKLIIKLGKQVLTGYPFQFIGGGWKNLIEAAQDFFATVTLAPLQSDSPLKLWKSRGWFTNTYHPITSHQKCLQILKNQT